MSDTVHVIFSSDHVVYLHLFVSFFFVLSKNITMTYPVKGGGGTDTKVNNHSSNFNGNMYDMREIK